MTFNEINVLGNIIDTTWGKSSSGMAGVSCKVSLLNDTEMSVTYNEMGTFTSMQEMQERKKDYDKNSADIIKQVITLVKEKFRESAGRALRLKTSEPINSFEVTGVQPHVNARVTALYRNRVLCKVE